MSTAESDENPRDVYVAAFGRGLSVIRCLSRSRLPLTIAEVAKDAGLNRATARRFLHTLTAEGYVRAENGRYSLRPSVMELGHAYLSSMAVDQFLHQWLLALADRLHESCSAGVLDGHDIVFVARAETSYPRIMTLALTVGARVPAYLTALGRVLLAELPEDELAEYLRTARLHKETERTVADPAALHREILAVRETGFCVMDQEIELGVRAAAVPVRRPGMPTIAISAAAHASRETIDSMRAKFLPALRDTAGRIGGAAPA